MVGPLRSVTCCGFLVSLLGFNRHLILQFEFWDLRFKIWDLGFVLWWGSWDLSLVTVLWYASLALTDSSLRRLAPTRGRIYLLKGNLEFLLWWGPWDLSLVTVSWFLCWGLIDIWFCNLSFEFWDWRFGIWDLKALVCFFEFWKRIHSRNPQGTLKEPSRNPQGTLKEPSGPPQGTGSEIVEKALVSIAVLNSGSGIVEKASVFIAFLSSEAK